MAAIKFHHLIGFVIGLVVGEWIYQIIKIILFGEQL